MSIKTAYTTEKLTGKAVDAIKASFSEEKLKALIYFASSSYGADELAAAMQQAFDAVPVFGCTTAGEIVSGKMLDNSIVAMALGSDVIDDISITVAEKVSTGDKTTIQHAFSSFEKYFNTAMPTLDFTKYVGIILTDGMSGAEERLMEWIGDLTNVTFVGGSAGDDLAFNKTYLFAHGKAYTDAALLVLIQSARTFDIVKTQSFKILDRTLTATKVDEQNREVLEFDNRPAVDAYAEAVGVPVAEVTDYFMKYPLGLVIDGEPYVRSPQQVKNEGIVFYCQILEGMELSLLESGDIVGDTKVALEEKEKELGSLSGILNFHCILRTLELKEEGKTDAYGTVFSHTPTIGFSTYGEEYLGHINQTSTMLVFR